MIKIKTEKFNNIFGNFQYKQNQKKYKVNYTDFDIIVTNIISWFNILKQRKIFVLFYIYSKVL